VPEARPNRGTKEKEAVVADFLSERNFNFLDLEKLRE
jgi:hypothetical protein